CEWLEHLLQGSKSYLHLSLYDPEGNAFISVGNKLDAIPEDEIATLMKKAKARDKAVITSVHNHGNDKPEVHLAHRITDATGITVGYLIAKLAIVATMNPIMHEVIGLGQTGETYLINTQGKMITPSRFPGENEAGGNRKIVSNELVERCRAGQKTGYIYKDYRGREVLGYCVWMHRPQWGVLAEIDTDEIFRPIYFVRTAVLLSGVLLLGVIILVSAAFASGITKPVRRLARAVAAVGEGDLSAKVPEKAKGEVQQLAKAFNEMVQQLWLSQEELAHKQSELQVAYDELVKAQHRLVQHEKMAGIGQFTASVIHEMRNPLTSIKMNLQILERQFFGDDHQHKHLEIAQDAAQRLERMFNDLLNFAKPIDIKLATTPWRNLIDGVITEFTSDLQRHQIETLVTVEPSDLQTEVDPNRFRQALINLVGNAVEAMPDGGRLTLHAWRQNGEIILEVKDTGIGIPPDQQTRLFEPFFTTKENGVGLGLLVVKKIVEAHDGFINLESAPGKGTTARIHL
ncbi:MAG: ATP-binding protein, partial [Alphaproteobacteria bacterium]